MSVIAAGIAGGLALSRFIMTCQELAAASSDVTKAATLVAMGYAKTIQAKPEAHDVNAPSVSR